MAWKHYILIVPVAHVATARALAINIAPGNSAKDILTTPLASAAAPLITTHYISSGLIQEEFAALLGQSAAVYAANEAENAKTAEVEIPVPLLAIQEMFAASVFKDVSVSETEQVTVYGVTKDVAFFWTPQRLMASMNLVFTQG